MRRLVRSARPCSAVGSFVVAVAILAAACFAVARPALAQCGIGWTLASGNGPGSYEICYDEARGRTVLFSGTTTYEWDGVAWETVAVSGPPDRGAAAMVYDPVGARCLLFGGYSSVGARKDLWAWNGVTWTQLASAPAEANGRGDFAMAFDRLRNKLIVHGGWPGSGALLSDTLEYDGASGTWTRFANGAIGNRYAHRMAFDEARGEIILHGGYYFGNRNDTWRWNGATWTLVSTSGPARYVFGMTYDSARARILLHGGTTCCGEVEYGQTYTWDGAGWTLCPTLGPPRGYLNIAYDRARDVIVMPGGLGPTPSGRAFIPETWELAMSLPPSTIRVPEDFATIQAAVDAAVDGDTVLVAPGTYDESVDLRGKEILVKSEVLRGASVRAPNGSRSFVASSGEGQSTRIIGFRLGRAGKFGGGLEAVGSSPVVDACWFEDCRNEAGGAARVQDGAPLFVACRFVGCVATGNGPSIYGSGGAVWSRNASPTFDRCLFEDCLGPGNAHVLMQENGGGAVARDCVFRGREATAGFHLYVVDGGLLIEDCIFDAFGPDATIIHGWSPFTLRRSQFTNNACGKMFEVKSGTSTVTDCIIRDSSAGLAVFGKFYSGTYAVGNTRLCTVTGPRFEGAWTDLGGNDFEAICPCDEDITGDGVVGAQDLAIVLSGWQTGPGSNAGDVSGDGETNGVDVALILSNWGVCN